MLFEARLLRRGLLACPAAIVATLLTGCGFADRPPPTDTRGDWPVWGGDGDNTRFSRSAQITAANVSRLRVAWTREEGPRPSGWQTFPVVVDDTMYYSTNTGEVLAVAAASGRVRWTFTPKVDFFADPEAVAVAPVNRGVTVAHGRVYLVTHDAQLIALDATTGAQLWGVHVADPVTGAVLNSPPVVWRDSIIVGGPAGPSELRGFVAAYAASTGRRLWRTFVVPVRGQGWLAPSSANGGGHVWMPPVVDRRTGVVYAATGNPEPALQRASRPGCNRWTDATVAIDASNGRIKWGYSAMCDDTWDYDVTQSPVLFDVRRNGRSVPAVADANKAGFVYILDRRTGAELVRSAQLVRSSAPRRRPTPAGVIACPGIFGGIGYGPSAYSPQTRLLYVTATNACMRYRSGLPRTVAGLQGAHARRGTATVVGAASGVLVAVDPASGRLVWRTRLPQPARGGVLATAGGLLFTGDDDGILYAVDARSGHIVWRYRIGLRFGSAPFAYELDGRQYVAVAAGGSAATDTGPGLAKLGGRLFVFHLPD